MSTPINTPPAKPHFCDPDHYVMKLKYEKVEEFDELVLSHITRLLDLPGAQLEVLRGRCEPPKENFNKLNLGSKKLWNSLKKKETKSLAYSLCEESLTQIQQLTDFLANHLTKEGLFRKPGNSVRQSQLLTALSTGVCINFEKSQFQAHDAASVLKTILGQLSEPLLMPSRHFEAHIQIANMRKMDFQRQETIPDKGKRIEALQLLLLLLPTANRKVLRGVFDLLYQTAKNQKENKMNAANLSAMFTPHLIWPRSAKASDIHDNVSCLNDHIAFIIRHSQKLFFAPPYIRDASRQYFHSSEINCLSPQVSSTLLVAPSSAVKRTASERLRNNEKDETESAINDLYDQVNNLPNSSKKKKIIKNFAKHEEVLKYQSKSRKRHRTLSGLFRKKTLQLNKSKEQVPQSKNKTIPILSKAAQRKLSDLAAKAETASLSLEPIKPVNNKTLSRISLPERYTRSCQGLDSNRSLKLSALPNQVLGLHHGKSDSLFLNESCADMSVRTDSPKHSKKSVKISSV